MLTPHDLGLPSKFESWRPGQWDAIDRFLTTDKRAGALCLPTGAGKSAVYMALARLFPGRTAILVSTRGLQDQLEADFAGMGLHDFRGQQNYECVAVRAGGELSDYGYTKGRTYCDFAPCHAGKFCSKKPAMDNPNASGCLYYDARRIATRTPLLLTNYSAYLSAYLYGDSNGLGTWDTLIMDEAHEAVDELTSACSIELKFETIEQVLGTKAYPSTEKVEDWYLWSRRHVNPLRQRIKQRAFGSDRDMIRGKRLLQQLEAMERLSKADDWIGQGDNGTIRFEPIYVERLAEPWLFRHAKRLLLVSATVRPKTLRMLGLDPDTCEIHEAPSPFPVANRRITHIPTTAMNFRTSESELLMLVKRVDSIIRARSDRNGIIHCTSYKRAQLVLNHSEFRHLMMTHTSESARAVIAKFKASPEPRVLLSPSVTTGYDFPEAECEYQILLKVPFPDSRPPIMQVRTFLDKDYPAYLAMQTIVQTVGRGVRTPTDRCETFVLDNNVRWFLRNYRTFAPAWFLEGYQISETLPPAPPRLARALQ